jgi:hypothetical protein
MEWYDRRPRRTSAPYPSGWRDRLMLGVLMGGMFVTLLLVIAALFLVVQAVMGLIQVVRGHIA